MAVVERTDVPARRPETPLPGSAARRPISSMPGPDVVHGLLTNLGGMVTLACEVLASMFTRRPIWAAEFFDQCGFILRAAIPAAMLVNFVFGLAIIGLTGGIPLSQLGAIDRDPSFVGPGMIREFGVFMTGSVFAGVLGTTIAAEFGARKIREELEALAVLGVDVIRSMVVPRVAALCVMQVFGFVVAFLAGAFGAFLGISIFFHAPTGTFIPQLLANVSYIDLWAALVKVVLFGFVIGVIACYKGLNSEGGAEGVGRAVNESVVACLVAVFFISAVYTQFLLVQYPDLTASR